MSVALQRHDLAVVLRRRGPQPDLRHHRLPDRGDLRDAGPARRDHLRPERGRTGPGDGEEAWHLSEEIGDGDERLGHRPLQI